MTIKELAAVMADDTTYAVLIGPEQEIIIGKEDKALMELLGNVEVDHAMTNGTNRLAIFAAVDLRRAAV